MTIAPACPIRDQTIVTTGQRSATDYPDELRRIEYRGPETGRTLNLPDQQRHPAGADHRKALQMPLAGRTVLQMDRAAPAHQARLRQYRERRRDPGLDRRLRLRSRYVLIAIIEKRLDIDTKSLRDTRLDTILPVPSVTVFEKTPLLLMLSEAESTEKNHHSITI